MAVANNSALSSSLAGVVSALDKVVSLSGASIDGLQDKAAKAKVWQTLIGDTLSLQKELRLAGQAGSDSVGRLQIKLAEHQAALEKAGLSVTELSNSYSKLGQVTRGVALIKAGQEHLAAGKAQIEQTVQRVRAPVHVAAEFQASVRDIAIKGGFANSAQEGQVAHQIRQAADNNGMKRNELAGAVGQLVNNGVKADEAASYSALLAKFSVGQGVSSDDTARLIQSLAQSGGIKDAAGMGQALERLAAAGQSGGMNSASMAKVFPGLLAEMARNGVTGQTAVDQLSSMLQVQQQMQASGDPAATADALKAWLSAQNGTSADKPQALLAAYAGAMKNGQPGHDAALTAALTRAQAAAPAGAATPVLDRSLQARQQTSAYKWNEVANAQNAAMEAMGQALLPVSNLAADAASGVLRFGTSLIETHPKLAAVVGSAYVGANALGAAWKVGQGAVEMARGAQLLGRSGMLGKLGAALPGKAGKIAGAAAVLLGGAADGADKAGGAGVQRVFVVNLPGHGQTRPTGAKLASRASQKNGKVGQTARAAKLSKQANSAKVAKPTKASPRAKPGRAGERLGRRKGAAAAGRPAGRSGRALAGASLARGLYEAVKHPEQAKEKAKESLVAAGGWAGGLAGARLGASIGALGGPIGMAVGGAIGGVVGSIGGEKIGEWLGNKALPEASHSAPAGVGGPAPAGEGRATPAAMPPAPSFSPTIQITVQGDVKDPRLLANELMPYLQTMFDQFRAQAGRGAMYDVAPEW